MAGNKDLQAANKAKKDEFYTQLADVEKEMKYYRDYFKGKTVFLNCDDPEESNFWQYFQLNFERLGLKRLISTHFDPEKPTYKLELVGDITGDGKVDGYDIVKTPLKQNGDFRSPECVALLEEADVVITNPPFSLFREYLAQLVEHKKDFIILGNQNAITYKEVFPLIMSNKIWLGASIHSGDREFRVPDEYPLKSSGWRVDESGNKYIRVKGIRWYSNIDYSQRHEDLLLCETYTPEKYPEYDNYKAINVDKTLDIPMDYDGVMGVPITFLDKYNPSQFEILGATESEGKGFSNGLWIAESGVAQPLVDGKKKYKRLFIRKRK